MKFDDQLVSRAGALLEVCRAKKIMISTAESCTGGLISALLTSVAGSYTNEAKSACLGVPASLIAAHGAVSSEVAEAMALGAIENSGASLSASVTGIAGPGGGSVEKPVGLVFIGSCCKTSEPIAEKHIFSGDRDAVRAQSVDCALALLTRQAQIC
jgi:nicotinamide-nucleotide amidase